MTDLNVPTDNPSRQSATPITVRHGAAMVTYRPGGPVEVGIDLGHGLIVTGAGPAEDLRICLTKALNPLAETQDVARRVVALGVSA